MARTLAEARAAAVPSKWRPRPVLSFVVRASIVVVPLVAAVLLARWVAGQLPAPTDGTQLLLEAMAVGTVGVAAYLLLRKAASAFLPLAVLLRLSMAFPGAAPNRFRAALRHTVRPDRVDTHALGAPRDSTEALSAARLLSLVARLSDHDRLTRGHSERVRAYAELIGEQMGLEERDLERLRWGALLHDIGKLDVPAAILNSPNRLTDEEYRIVKTHPEAGDVLVGPLKPFLGDWAYAVRHHHERWDGNGYPDRLAGERIPLAGRIVAVADAFDVITAARSYKEPRSHEEGRAELVNCAGTQFDPDVVRAFLAVGTERVRAVGGIASVLSGLSRFLTLPGGSATGAGLGAAAVAATSILGTLATGVVQAPVVVAEVVSDYVPPFVVRADGDEAADTTTTSPTTTSTTAPASTTTPTTAPTTTATTLPPLVVPPLALQTVEDVAASLDLATVVDGGAPSVQVVAPPAAGTASVSGSVVRYAPAAGVSGADAFALVACVGERCDRTTVSVSVAAVNDAPVAVNDRAVVDEGAVVAVNVLANDTDPDGDALTIQRVTGVPATVATIAGNAIRVTATEPGALAMTYEVVDGNGGVARARLDVAVRDVNDAPLVVLDRVVTDDVTPVTVAVLANDTDPDGDALVLQSISAPALGTARISGPNIVYTPSPGVAGVERLQYVVRDAGGLTVGGRLEVEVRRREARSPTLIASDPAKTTAVPLGGAPVSGDIYVHVPDDGTIFEVHFWLDDPDRSGPIYAREQWTTYDLAGTVGSGPNGRPFDTRTLANGRHVITTTVLYLDGSTQTRHHAFEVRN
ncbi:MAG: tandem-95 repeat protein [Actinomycetota bacterium]|nr:tandem-95 repeat protein [Actinomycetota bacterium]